MICTIFAFTLEIISKKYIYSYYTLKMAAEYCIILIVFIVFYYP